MALKTIFFNGFAIFHRHTHTKGLWKIAKFHNHLVKFCVKNDPGIFYFFQKMEFLNSTIFLKIPNNGNGPKIGDMIKNYLNLNDFF